jgi:hypothetical protein
MQTERERERKRVHACTFTWAQFPHSQIADRTQQNLSQFRLKRGLKEVSHEN